MLQRVYTRVSKPAARYSDRGSMAEHCSACRFFMSGGDCARVLGRVMPGGWCKYFSREAVQRWNPLWPMEGIPAPPGATLDLSFLTSGALDPRITFTRASTATYFNSAGVMQTAAVNAPRWDYNPSTLALQGLLIEDARPNLVTNSVPFTGWSPTNMNLTASAGVAPDGTNSMVRMSEQAVTSFHLNLFNTTVVASATYTLSASAKAAEDRYLQLLLDNNAGTGSWVTFDLQAGVISGPLAASGVAAGTASMNAVGGGVYRCSLTGTVGASTTARCSLGLSNIPNPGAFPPYAGNTANGLLAWGVQLEPGAFPTSYIPTTGATVTRASDLCFIPPANMTPWYASPGGTWQAEFIDLDYDTAGGGAIVIGQSGGGGLPLPMYVDHPATALGQWDGTGTLLTANYVTLGVVSKGATTWFSTIERCCLNGGAVASGGSAGGGYPSLGSAGVGFLNPSSNEVDNMAAGYIRRVRYWPRILTNAEMQQVTT